MWMHFSCRIRLQPWKFVFWKKLKRLENFYPVVCTKLAVRVKSSAIMWHYDRLGDCSFDLTQTTQELLGLFVLIWMRISCWIQIRPWKFEFWKKNLKLENFVKSSAVMWHYWLAWWLFIWFHTDWLLRNYWAVVLLCLFLCWIQIWQWKFVFEKKN